MSLITCPSCRNKISSVLENCPNCQFSFNSEEDIDQLKKNQYRVYRDRMYLYKMLTFLSVTIAVIGAVPMLWAYAKAIDYGFNANLTNHWGIFLVIFGFSMYVILRVLMFLKKRNYNTRK